MRTHALSVVYSIARVAKREPEELSRSRLFGWVLDALEVPRWGQLLLLALFAAFSGVALGLLHISSKLDVSVQSSQQHIEQVERELNSRIDRVQSELIDTLLKDAKRNVSLGRTEDALGNVQLTSALLSASIKNKTKAPDTFFLQAVLTLDDMRSGSSNTQLLKSINRIRVALADYRSAIQESPPLPSPSQAIGESRILPPPPYMRLQNVFRWAGPPGGEFIHRAAAVPVTISGGAFADGTQTIDGITWIGTVFLNCHIRYQGGVLSLDHVTFVNCTFEVADNPRAYEAVDLIALHKPMVAIPGSS